MLTVDLNQQINTWNGEELKKDSKISFTIKLTPFYSFLQIIQKRGDNSALDPNVIALENRDLKRKVNHEFRTVLMHTVVLQSHKKR